MLVTSTARSFIDYVLDPGPSGRWQLPVGRDHVVIDDVQAVQAIGCPARHGAPHSEALLQAVPALR